MSQITLWFKCGEDKTLAATIANAFGAAASKACPDLSLSPNAQQFGATFEFKFTTSDPTALLLVLDDEVLTGKIMDKVPNASEYEDFSLRWRVDTEGMSDSGKDNYIQYLGEKSSVMLGEMMQGQEYAAQLEGQINTLSDALERVNYTNQIQLGGIHLPEFMKHMNKQIELLGGDKFVPAEPKNLVKH